jgi:molybdopterin converting factor small subunit
MATVFFTAHLRRYVPTSGIACTAATLRDALDQVCRDHPAVRGYIFDDQGRLRRHVNVFIEGTRVTHRDSLDVPVGDGTEIYVMQALSGG